ncbi:MAG TPA: hypothetical protein EYG71_04705 [Leucothrix sp.]|nr:hypothetical protein [Leucothrix sp.]
MRDADDQLTFFYCGDLQQKVFKLIEKTLDDEDHLLINFYNEFVIDIYMLLDRSKSKYVAIDWDNTISADMDFFLLLIKKLQQAGFTPFVCTLRAPDDENIKEIKDVLEETNIAIYLTGGKPKRKYMKELGVKVHLWIDDFYPGICGDDCKMLGRNNIE